MIDRRGTLKAGAAILTAATVSAPAAAMARDISERDWKLLAAALSRGADLYRPGDPGYGSLEVPFNHRYEGIRPAGIVACATTGDVSTAIKWAEMAGLSAVPRSGAGHNYAGYSTTTGLLLSMGRMKCIAVSAKPGERMARSYGPIGVEHDAGTVTVQAGVTNGDIHPLLEDEGIFVPTGRCPSVGVAGLVLGGGIGFSDKMFGLTCDRLIGTTVVLADGSVVRADEDSAADLFWACRGGAGNNFGVHTSFTFAYDRFCGNVAFYSFKWSIDRAVPVMGAAQRIAASTAGDRRFHCRLGLGTAGSTRREIIDNFNVNIIGQHYGNVDDLLEILAPLLALGTVQERAANRASVRKVSPGRASELLSATTPVIRFAAKSAIVTCEQTLDDEHVQDAVDQLLAWPGSTNPDGAGLAMFGLGGMINQMAPDTTAFVHRDGLFALAAEATWADQDPAALAQANELWLEDFYSALFGPTAPRSAYQNFPDPTLTDWRNAYYGENYDRLTEVKAHYDPTGFFRYPQAIGN